MGLVYPQARTERKESCKSVDHQCSNGNMVVNGAD